MSWLYGQTWLWYLIAFLVGVVLAWLLLVRPQQRRLQAGAPTPGAVAQPSAPTAKGDGVDTPHLGTVAAGAGVAAGAASIASRDHATRTDDEATVAVDHPAVHAAVEHPADDSPTETLPAVDPALSTLDSATLARSNVDLSKDTSAPTEEFARVPVNPDDAPTERVEPPSDTAAEPADAVPSNADGHHGSGAVVAGAAALAATAAGAAALHERESKPAEDGHAGPGSDGTVSDGTVSDAAVSPAGGSPEPAADDTVPSAATPGTTPEPVADGTRAAPVDDPTTILPVTGREATVASDEDTARFDGSSFPTGAAATEPTEATATAGDAESSPTAVGEPAVATGAEPDPAPADPGHVGPTDGVGVLPDTTTPADPAPIDPAPIDPAPIDSAPIGPASVGSAPVEPAPAEPAAAGSDAADAAITPAGTAAAGDGVRSSAPAPATAEAGSAAPGPEGATPAGGSGVGALALGAAAAGAAGLVAAHAGHHEDAATTTESPATGGADPHDSVGTPAVELPAAPPEPDASAVAPSASADTAVAGPAAATDPSTADDTRPAPADALIQGATGVSTTGDGTPGDVRAPDVQAPGEPVLADTAATPVTPATTSIDLPPVEKSAAAVADHAAPVAGVGLAAAGLGAAALASSAGSDHTEDPATGKHAAEDPDEPTAAHAAPADGVAPGDVTAVEPPSPGPEADAASVADSTPAATEDAAATATPVAGASSGTVLPDNPDGHGTGPAAGMAAGAAAVASAAASTRPDTGGQPASAGSSPTEPPFGPGSARPTNDGSAPGVEYSVKGNSDSMLYHTPESPYYMRTRAEAWFTTTAAAEAAGFTPWNHRRKDAALQGLAAAAPAWTPGPYPHSALPETDGSSPSPEFAIKGNSDSMLFHAPDSPYYSRTRAEAWFRTAAEAEEAGFTAYIHR